MGVAVALAEAQGTIIGRALELLGSGVPQEAVASALGVSASYISQLLSDADFAAAVTKLKYDALSKHTERDETYDNIEDRLLAKLDHVLPLMLRPADIVGALKMINGAKRRGTDSKESIVTQQNIVEITMPVQIVQNFTTNMNNQVIKAGEQDLVTIQSDTLLKATEKVLEAHRENAQIEVLPEDISIPNPAPNESNPVLDSL